MLAQPGKPGKGSPLDPDALWIPKQEAEQNQAEMPSALVCVVPFALVVALPH